MPEQAKNSIPSAPIWFSLCCLALLLSGCASWPSWFTGVDENEVKIVKQAQERLPLALADPAPLSLRGPRWIIVTPDNIDQVWRDLEEKKIDLVLFAVTDDGYEELALNMAQIRNFIAQQREIIIKYREYYEPAKPPQPAK